MTQAEQPQADKPAKTELLTASVYPEDLVTVDAVAAEQFRYNRSEATRYIIRHFRDCQRPQPEPHANGVGA